MDKLIKKTARIMKPEADSLRIYWLCEGCRGKIQVRGQGKVTPSPGVMVV